MFDKLHRGVLILTALFASSAVMGFEAAMIGDTPAALFSRACAEKGVNVYSPEGRMLSFTV